MYRGCPALVRLIATLTLLTAFTLAYADSSTESLHYRASYEGLLSAGNKIPIADIHLETAPADLPAGKKAVFETRMSVSSGAYDFVENSFPFRVSYRSLYEAEPFISLALEKYQKTQKLKHEVSWMGRDDGKLARYRRLHTEKPGDTMPDILEQWLEASPGFSFYKFAPHGKKNNPVDYLTMLQALRHSDLQLGREFRFPVTDGRKFYDYRVSVVGSERVRARSTLVDSWKLRLDGKRIKKGKSYPDHEPVLVWITKDESRTPIRFENTHSLGQFIIELTDEHAQGAQVSGEGGAAS